MEPANITKPIFAWLKKISLFRSLNDGQVYKIARSLHVTTFTPGQVIGQQGQIPQFFAIVHTGKVAIQQRQNDASAPPLQLNEKLPGDYFGEAELLYSQRTFIANAVATVESELYTLPAAEFRDLLRRYPLIKEIVTLADHTYRLAAARNFGAWLQEGEHVLMILNKHWLWLFEKHWIAIMAAPLTMAVLHIAWWYVLPWSWWLLVFPFVLFFGAWLGYIWVDFNDDNYVLTNRRVIAAERIVLIKDKRIEIALANIRSVDISQSPAEKIFGAGDIRIQTFTDTLKFETVPTPQAVLHVLTDLQERSKEDQKSQDLQTLRQQIGTATGRIPTPPAETFPPPPAPAPLPLWQTIFPRLDKPPSGTITFHTHWFFLLKRIWISLSVLLVGILMLMTLVIPNIRAEEDIPATVLYGAGATGLVLLVGLGLFWFYYEDWDNDIYRVLADKVIDLQLTPLFGRVQQQSTGLESVQSVTYQQPSFWARVLNYGDVVVQTGANAAPLVFKNIDGPVKAQQIIFQNLETFRLKKEQDDRRRINEEIIRYLTSYDTITREESQTP